MEIKPVGILHSPIEGKFGVPRQSGLAGSLVCELELLPPYNRPEALRGLEGFDYIWLIWEFSLSGPDSGRESAGGPPLTVRPPRLGGNARVGVFASRSPFRPNRLGLSSVRIAGIDSARGVIRVLGADLADGTPVFDIKPYIAYADSHPEARGGFTEDASWKPLRVEFRLSQGPQLPSHGSQLPESLSVLPKRGFGGQSSGQHSQGPRIAEPLDAQQLAALKEILSQDPRPRYQDDPQREYGLLFEGRNVRFRVKGDTLTVFSVE